MKNLFKKSSAILRNNLILVQPFLLYWMFILLTLPYFIRNNINIYPKFLLFISVILLTAAQIAGWFFVNKTAVNNYNETDTKEEINIKSVNNIKTYFSGIGEYFFKSLFALILYFVISTMLFYGLYKACLILNLDTSVLYKFADVVNAKTNTEIQTAILSFSKKELLLLSIWCILFTAWWEIIKFSGLLYFAVLFSEKTNIITAIFKTITILLKNIFSAIAIILFTFTIYVLINLITILLGANTIAFTVFIIAFAMYLNYYIILVFCFYNDRTKNNSGNGSEFIG